MSADYLRTERRAAEWLIRVTDEGTAGPGDVLNKPMVAGVLLDVMDRRVTEARRLLNQPSDREKRLAALKNAAVVAAEAWQRALYEHPEPPTEERDR